MATLVLTDAYISIDSNDLSAYGNQVTLDLGVEVQDETAFGDSTRINKAGLKTWSMEIQFNQDFADNLLDEILHGIYDARSAVTCAVRPTSSSKGAANPEYTGSGIITAYSPIRNSVGELAGATISIASAGDLTRSVS